MHILRVPRLLYLPEINIRHALRPSGESGARARDRNRRKLNFPTLFATGGGCGHRLEVGRFTEIVNVDLVHYSHSDAVKGRHSFIDNLLCVDLQSHDSIYLYPSLPFEMRWRDDLIAAETVLRIR